MKTMLIIIVSLKIYYIIKVKNEKKAIGSLGTGMLNEKYGLICCTI